MIVRSFLIAIALLAGLRRGRGSRRPAATSSGAGAARRRHRHGDIVRIGDLIDNAGSAAQIAIFRAPDLGTTGSLPVAQVIDTLRAHQVIGVDTRDIREISVTRLARTLEGKDIEQQIARALERRNGLGDAANLSLTFDRDLGDVSSMPPTPAACRPPSCASIRATAASTSPSRSPTTAARRRPGCASPARRSRPSRPRCWPAASSATKCSKSSDVVVERRPKAEVGNDAAAARPRRRHAGAHASCAPARRCKVADLAKPDLVQRDQNVTLIYEVPGLYLTVRGKAIESGTEGDVVNVAESAIQAHGARRRHRPRPGVDLGRHAPPGACHRHHLLARHHRARRSRRRRQRQFASRSKSRVMSCRVSVSTASFSPAPAGAGSFASGCSSIDRLSRSAKSRS